MKEIKCPKCGSTMSEGMRVDSTYGNMAAESWVPSRYFDDKLSVYDLLGMKLRREGKQVVTYACDGCGYLESYIKEIVDAMGLGKN